MGRFGFRCKIHDLNYFSSSLNSLYIEVVITILLFYFAQYHRLNVIYHIWNNLFENYLFNITMCTPTCIIFYKCRLFYIFVVKINCLVAWIDTLKKLQYIFFPENSNLADCFQPLSLKSKVVRLIVVAPICPTLDGIFHINIENSYLYSSLDSYRK